MGQALIIAIPQRLLPAAMKFSHLQTYTVM